MFNSTGTAVANSLIPYTHFGISLITLLRIGLSGTTKTRLYGQFLQIPVYEGELLLRA